jgi:hypothetical protein
VDDKLSILAAMKKVLEGRLAIPFRRLKTLDHITGGIKEM